MTRLLDLILRRARRLAPADGFARQVAIVGGGAAFVQAIGILASPFLTRLYGPAEFGVMAAFSALSEILVLVATLRYEAAVPIAKTDEEAAQLLVAAATGVGLVSSLILLLSLALPPSAYRILSSDPAFFTFRYFLVVAVAGGAWYTCLVAWVTRRRQFGLLTKSKAYQSSTSIAVQLGIGSLGGGLLGLVLGSVTNMTAGIWMLLRQTIRDLREGEISIRRERVRAVAWEFRAYPTFTIWTSLLNLVGRSVPTLLLSAVHGANVTGFYGLGMRVVGLPSALVSVAVSNVFLSRVGEAARAGTLGSEAADVTARLSRLSAFIFSILAVFGPELFGLVFGARWLEAGSYVRWLSPWLYLTFVFSPQTSIVLAKGRQATDALIQVPILAVRILFLVVGSRWHGAAGAIAGFGVASALTSIAYFAWVLRIAGASLRTIGVGVVKDLAISLGSVGACRIAFEATSRSPLVMVGTLLAVALLLQRRIWEAWRTDASARG